MTSERRWLRERLKLFARIRSAASFGVRLGAKNF
jgi:hypothetical protein